MNNQIIKIYRRVYCERPFDDADMSYLRSQGAAFRILRESRAAGAPSRFFCHQASNRMADEAFTAEDEKNMDHAFTEVCVEVLCICLNPLNTIRHKRRLNGERCPSDA